MSDGYRVNTDELEAVVRRLRTLQQNVSTCGSNTKYKTDIGRDAFGGDFVEAHGIFSAHATMQQNLTKAITDLDNLINTYGDKTQAATDNYKTSEEDGKAGMNRAGAGA